MSADERCRTAYRKVNAELTGSNNFRKNVVSSMGKRKRNPIQQDQSTGSNQENTSTSTSDLDAVLEGAIKLGQKSDTTGREEVTVKRLPRCNRSTRLELIMGSSTGTCNFSAQEIARKAAFGNPSELP